MQLDGAQREQIEDALMNAFKMESLTTLLQHKLGWRIDLITLPKNFAEAVEKVVVYAEAQENGVCRLLTAAKNAQSANRLLQECFAAICEGRPAIAGPPPNPFGYTNRIERPNRYVVPRELHRQVIEELNKGQNLCLIGGPKTGKSSYLQFLRREGLDRLNAALPDHAFTDLLSLPLDWIRNDDEFYEFFCSEIGLSETLHGFRLERAIRGRRILLCIDDVEKLMWDSFTRHLHSDLRGFANGINSPLTLIVATDKPLRDYPAEGKFESPLPNIHFNLWMPPFSTREVQQLITQRAGDYANRFNPVTIHAQTGGHAGRVQQQLREQWQTLFGAQHTNL